jgi:hypothetical protein
MSNVETTRPLVRPIETHNSSPSSEDLLTRGAAAWDLSRAATIAILVAPIFVAASGVAAAIAGKEIYKWYTEEDGVAETMQVLLYAASWIMCLAVMRLHAKAGNRLITALYLVLACGLFFLVGEEVSWGQRIFGWGTPEALSAVNKQDETNLHNIYGVGSTFKWVQMLVGAYGTFLPLIFFSGKLLPRYRPIIDAVVPHYTLIVFFLPMFVWRLYRNLAGDPSRYYYLITNYNEVIELILALGFCLFLTFQLRKCRREMGRSVPAR